MTFIGPALERKCAICFASITLQCASDERVVPTRGEGRVEAQGRCARAGRREEKEEEGQTRRCKSSSPYKLRSATTRMAFVFPPRPFRFRHRLTHASPAPTPAERKRRRCFDYSRRGRLEPPQTARQPHRGGEAVRRASGENASPADSVHGQQVAQGQGEGLQRVPVETVRAPRHTQGWAGIRDITE